MEGVAVLTPEGQDFKGGGPIKRSIMECAMGLLVEDITNAVLLLLTCVPRPEV